MDMVYKAIFLLVFSILLCLRLYFKLKYHTLKDPVFNRMEGVGLVLLRWVLSVPLVIGFADYIMMSPRLAWLYLSLPNFIRIVGGIVCVCSLFLLYSVHRSLGENFSTTLLVRSSHTLVKSGPYRYMRHPMYTAYLLLFAGAFMLSASWLIGLSGSAVIATLMIFRIKKEEQLLLSVFGHEYARYRSITGMFIPRIPFLPGTRLLAGRTKLPTGDEGLDQ